MFFQLNWTWPIIDQYKQLDNLQLNRIHKNMDNIERTFEIMFTNYGNSHQEKDMGYNNSLSMNF